MPNVVVHHRVPVIRYSSPAIILNQIIWVLFTIVGGLLVLRFVFRILGANPSAQISTLIYSLSQPFAEPFVGVFPSTPLVGAGVVDWSVLSAMLVYALMATLLIRVFTLSSGPTSTTEIEE